MTWKRRGISKTQRFEVFKRDNFTCQYCGIKAPAVQLRVDHIRAIKHGGDNAMSNLITSCFDCNAGKGARPLCEEHDYTKGWGWSEYNAAKALWCDILKNASDPRAKADQIIADLERDSKAIAPNGYGDLPPATWLKAHEEALGDGT